MVHPSSRFYRCLCRVIIAGMLFQTGCLSGHKTDTHYLPTEPRSTFRPLLEIGMWDLEVELRDESLIKVTPLNSEFGEALYSEPPPSLKPWYAQNIPIRDSDSGSGPLKVSGSFVSWDEETIRLKRLGVPFKEIKAADVYYDIPIEDAGKIIYKKNGMRLNMEWTAALIAVNQVFAVFWSLGFF